MSDFKTIKISDLQDPTNDYLLRKAPVETDKDYDTFITLKSDILERGLDRPITVHMDGSRFVIIDGMRRMTALRQLLAEGKLPDEVVVNVRSDSEYDALATSISLNHNSKKTLSRQEIDALMRIQIAQRLSLPQLATKVGMSEGYVTNLLKLNFLPENVKELIDGNKITLTNAIQLNKLDAEEVADKQWLTAAMTQSGEEFTTAVSQHLNEKAKAERAARKGQKPEFQPQGKLISKQAMEIKLSQAEQAFGDSPSDLNRGRLEMIKECFELDEVTIAAKRAEWEKTQADKEANAEKRAAEREAKKIADAKALLKEKGETL